MIFGGRGAPYHFRSRIRSEYDRVPKVFELLQGSLVELFPMLADAAITHRWGGALGIARDWHASVGLDHSTGHGVEGRRIYVGDGALDHHEPVPAGRFADLITGTDSALTTLPWVGHRSRNWEPEPLRWLGANAGLETAMTLGRCHVPRNNAVGNPRAWRAGERHDGAMSQPSTEITRLRRGSASTDRCTRWTR